MAKLFGPPEHIPCPEFNVKDFNQYQKDCEQFEKSLAEFCKEESPRCPDAGKIISFPVADGQAKYMVFKYSELIFIGTYDAYHVDDALIRGLRKADIVKKIKQRENISALFAKR